MEAMDIMAMEGMVYIKILRMWFTLPLTVQPCFHDNVYLSSLYQVAMVEVDRITVATVVMEEVAEVVADMETRVEATVVAAVAMITTTVVVVEAATLEEVSYLVNYFVMLLF